LDDTFAIGFAEGNCWKGIQRHFNANGNFVKLSVNNGE